jgi:hypothetical protein
MKPLWAGEREDRKAGRPGGGVRGETRTGGPGRNSPDTCTRVSVPGRASTAASVDAPAVMSSSSLSNAPRESAMTPSFQLYRASCHTPKPVVSAVRPINTTRPAVWPAGGDAAAVENRPPTDACARVSERRARATSM